MAVPTSLSLPPSLPCSPLIASQLIKTHLAYAAIRPHLTLAHASTASASRAMSAPPSPSPQQAVELLTLLERLKNTPRTGWVKRGVHQPESIADHMYRMAVMGMLVQGSPYDSVRCIKLAIVHDMAEAIVGDITPYCGVTDEDKHQQEREAVQQMKGMLGGCLAGDEIEQLWEEYEAAQTEEAKLVKDFDKIEMILQASEYEAAQGLTLQEFFDSTAGKWRTELGRSWAEEVCRRRAAGKAAAPQDPPLS